MLRNHTHTVNNEDAIKFAICCIIQIVGFVWCSITCMTRSTEENKNDTTFHAIFVMWLITTIVTIMMIDIGGGFRDRGDMISDDYPQ